MSEMKINNRVTAMTGTDYPIIQAPMGWIARAQLASAVSNAGGMGIIETSSGELDAIKIEIEKMRQLTDKPFGMNVALSYVKGTNIIDFVIEQGIRFVTTSSGSPSVCTKEFQQAGIKVFHVRVLMSFDILLFGSSISPKYIHFVGQTAAQAGSCPFSTL